MKGEIILLTVLCLFSFSAGAILGMNIQEHLNRREAVAAGVAEWVISDPETGEVQFTWKFPTLNPKTTNPE